MQSIAIMARIMKPFKKNSQKMIPKCNIKILFIRITSQMYILHYQNLTLSNFDIMIEGCNILREMIEEKDAD